MFKNPKEKYTRLIINIDHKSEGRKMEKKNRSVKSKSLSNFKPQLDLHQNHALAHHQAPQEVPEVKNDQPMCFWPFF